MYPRTNFEDKIESFPQDAKELIDRVLFSELGCEQCIVNYNRDFHCDSTGCEAGHLLWYALDTTVLPSPPRPVDLYAEYEDVHFIEAVCENCKKPTCTSPTTGFDNECMPYIQEALENLKLKFANATSQEEGVE